MSKTRRDVVEEIVRRKPGLTEIQIAEEIFSNPYQQRVNPICRAMVTEGRLRRSGRGGMNDPYTYTLAEKHRS